MLLSPGAKSLADLAPIVGEAKIKLADDPKAELAIKQNMKDFMLRQPDLFRAYALNDAAIPAKYAEQLIRKNASLTGDFALPVTLTSIGISLILSDWKSKGFDADDILGQKVHFDPKWIPRLGYFKQNTAPAPIDVVHWRLDFVTETYHGGRNEQFMYGIAPEADWYDWDLSGAYTTAMHLIGKPNWQRTEKINDLSCICIDDLAYFCVDFEFPPDVRFPVLPVRTPYGLIFPRKGRSNCAAPELLLARELNAKISIVEAWLVPTDKRTRIFESFIKYCNSQRKKAETTFDNLLWKELGNSTYGKTAQGLRKKRVYNIQDDEHETLPPSKITNPFFASFITSYVRAVLGEIMNALPRDALVFSVTTDGFLSTATDAYIEQAFKKPISASFRTARREISGSKSDRGIEMKHLVRQPVGWRTRGSCTFKPHPQKKGSVVLQKGGIKLDGDLTDEQENEIILNLFLDRSPGQKLRYTRGIGLRDMVTYGTDFVQIVAEKSLGMEYDWKRKPRNWVNTTAKSASRTATHLSFETIPLENFDEFIHYRTQWEAYNKRNRSCLKTTADLEAFNNFLDLRMSPKELQRYLKHRDNADVDRLANVVALAYASRHTMMYRYRLGGEMREDFCADVCACDIPITIAKLDHATRKLRALRKKAGRDAMPDLALCIKTDRVTKALARLKKKFPRLDEKAFFRADD